MSSHSKHQGLWLGTLALALLLTAAQTASPATPGAPASPEAPASPKPPKSAPPHPGSDHVVDVTIDRGGVMVKGQSVLGESTVVEKGIRVGSLDAFGDSGEITITTEGETLRVIHKGLMHVESNSEDVVRMGGNVEIAEDEVVEGDAVAIGGSVDIAGHVMGDAVAIGGDLHLAPTAQVDGEVVCVGGHLEKEHGAQVGGETVQVGIGLPGPFGKSRAHGFGRAFSPLFKLAQLLVMALIVYLILSFWGDRLRAMSSVLPLLPFKLGLVGMLCWILILPACLLLVISIIGILFLPVFLVLLFFAFLAGLVTVYLHIGERFQGGTLHRRPVAAALAGMLIVHLFSILGTLTGALFPFLSPLPGALSVFGKVLVFLAATVGIGCVLYTRFGKRNLPPAAPHAGPAPADPFGGFPGPADPFAPPPVPPLPPAPGVYLG